MGSPISSVRYIHKAIRTELEALEESVTRLDPEDGTRAADLARRFAFLYGNVKTHEDGEEDALLPLMDSRIYPVSAPYLLDHRVDQLHMQSIRESFDQLAGSRDADERAQPLRHLRRQAIVVSSAMALHIRKEEDILVPLIEQHFSVDEQKAIVNQAMAHFTPAATTSGAALDSQGASAARAGGLPAHADAGDAARGVPRCYSLGSGRGLCHAMG